MTAATKRWLMIALLVAVLFGLMLGGAAGTASAADLAGQIPVAVSVEHPQWDPTQADRMEAMLREMDAALQSVQTPGTGARAVNPSRAGGQPDFVRIAGALPWAPAMWLR